MTPAYAQNATSATSRLLLRSGGSAPYTRAQPYLPNKEVATRAQNVCNMSSSSLYPRVVVKHRIARVISLRGREKGGGRAPKTQPCSTALTIAPTVPTSNLFNSGSYHTDRDIAALAGWFESQSAMGQGPGLDSEMRRLGGPWHSPQGVVWKLQPLDLSTRREISRSPKGGNLADER